jgi:hypothetical protein
VPAQFPAPGLLLVTLYTDNLSVSCNGVKNEWSFIYTFPIRFHSGMLGHRATCICDVRFSQPRRSRCWLFWAVILCGIDRNQRFVGIYCLHIPTWRWRQHFSPKHWHVQIYTTSQPRRLTWQLDLVALGFVTQKLVCSAPCINVLRIFYLVRCVK